MWISGPIEGLENIFLLLQYTSSTDKRVCGAMQLPWSHRDSVDKLWAKKCRRGGGDIPSTQQRNLTYGLQKIAILNSKYGLELLYHNYRWWNGSLKCQLGA